MGPVRQNPIQRTVRTVLIISPLTPDNHCSSDVVCRRRRGL